MILFEESDSPLQRLIIEISVTKENTKNTQDSKHEEGIKDMVADYLEDTRTLDSKPLLAILILAEADQKKFFALEFIQNNVSNLHRLDKATKDVWVNPALESDLVFAKLLPYSDYIVLAKKGEKNILIHYYGDKGLLDRTI
jgi:hypothetical protein